MIRADTIDNVLGSWTVRNNSGSDIAANRIVQVSGATSDGYPRVAAAQANTAPTMLAVTGFGIPDGEDGDVREWVIVTGADTSTASAGDPVFLSQATAGAYTLTRPTAGEVITVGKVLTSSATTGTILLSPAMALTGVFGSFSGEQVYRITGTIAAASVKTLNAAPVSVIAAPGAGKAIMVDRVHWWLDFATAAYNGVDAGENLSLKYAGGAIATDAVTGAGFGDALADEHRFVGPATVEPTVNVAVQAQIAVGEWFATTGDSPLKYEIWYRIVTLEF